ncbi:MAG: hypothetical protein AAGC60_16380 [Acidobacteriota bacterium]
MSHIRQPFLGLPWALRLLFIVLFVSCAPAIHAGTHAALFSCDDAAPLAPNDTWRSALDGDAGSFHWHLPSPGLATVELLSPGTAVGALELRTLGCGGSAARVMTIERSADRLALAVHAAGSVVLVVDADRRPYRLDTSFVPADVVAEELGWRAARGGQHGDLRVVHTSFLTRRGSTDKTEPEIIDPDPDGLAAPDQQLAATFVAFQTIGRHKTEPEIIDPDPDGLAAPDSDGASAALHRVMLYEPTCRRPIADDHGDTLACATPLTFARAVGGELGNAYGDDRDVFSFELGRVERIAIALAGVSRDEVAKGRARLDASVTLTDAAGRRLAQRTAGTTSPRSTTGLELGATLPPGRYSVQVSGSAGRYALTLTTAD